MCVLAVAVVVCQPVWTTCEPDPAQAYLHAPLLQRLSLYCWRTDDEELRGQLAAERDALAERYIAAYDRILANSNPVPLDDSPDAVENLVAHFAAIRKLEITPLRLLHWAGSRPRNEAAFLAVSGFRHADLDNGFLLWMDAVAESCADMTADDFAVFARITRVLDGFYAEGACVAWFDAFSRCPVTLCEIMESDPCVAREIAGAFSLELYSRESVRDLFNKIPPESHDCARKIVQSLGDHRADWAD